MSLTLDGENDLDVELRYAPQEPPIDKPLPRYYLLGVANPALRPALIRLAGPWLADATRWPDRL